MKRLAMAVIVFLEIISNAVRLHQPRYLINLAKKETMLLAPETEKDLSVAA